ncbi:hypothetical protein E1178_04570 [Roseibium hamelinense]|nr:hypothetical protein [Roseibium hamelinense]MTI42878.1 hypothetical protein [Roseibium hamelinense]
MQIAAAIGSAIVSSAILGAAVFVPALIAIAAAEIFRWRSLFYFVGAGGALGFVVWNVGAADHATNLRPGTTVALASGFIGGFVYWIVAGRTSGSWAAAKRGN